ncbi:MAG: amidase [Lachnospiraceae bacterium]|nr:amidase [Lachnospiraceae bacterium]
MKKWKNRSIVTWLITSMLMTSLSPTALAAAEMDGSGIESYSEGPEYEFIEDTSAVDQLKDIFTTIDLQSATIPAMQQEMEAGNLTSEQLTQMYIDRIKAYDTAKNLNSIIWINENALTQAKELDRERAAGKVRGSLHGIPVLVKDNYNVAGMPTSAGSSALADMVVNEDSGAVKKLKEAGAVIVAKANLSEFAWSAVDSHSTLGGDVHNAYDTDRSSAGSSGGTATAVISNFAAAGLGTDTGGSIRNPSSWSNLYGIRPSKGLTSIAGVFPLLAARDTAGPMARNAEDMALVLETIAGEDEKDDYTVEVSADSLVGEGYLEDLTDNPLKGKRIGFLTSSFDYYTPDITTLNEKIREMYGIDYDLFQEGDLPVSANLSPEADALCRKARAALRKGGAQFVDLSGIEGLSDEELFPLLWLTAADSTEYDINKFLSEYAGDSEIKTLKDILSTGKNIGYIGAYMQSYLDSLDSLKDSYNADDYGEYGYGPYGEENYLRSEDWEYTLAFRKKITKIMEENQIDAIMYVYFTSGSATQNEYSYTNNDSKYDRIFGPVLGLPDVSIPMGFIEQDDVELPMGLSLVGRFGGEKELMEIAYGYEKEAGDLIKKLPSNSPALRDENLNSYLDALMEEACNIQPAKYGFDESSSEIKKLNDAYNKALEADYDDPDSVYNAAYELAVAYDKVTYDYLQKRKNAGHVFVRGQKLKSVSEDFFSGVEGINNYRSENKKVASVTKKGKFKAKKAGQTVIHALNAKNKKNYTTLSSCTITVVNKPKIKFEKSMSSEYVGKTIDAFDYILSDDIALLSPDKWTSSKEEVATISEAGKITIKGTGRTKITAYFGNVKVKGNLVIK